ncbi:hypothetical protein L6164_001302 [Bauhinia variegata]|uniref:Uncharacterized protein n=1 Tax=Bauhinia variegata TaxID=167791 RepID=A0ACB9QBB2_BAUVA|nr:hypothetical protein L6164_001302 [Bauhinia variegata]
MFKYVETSLFHVLLFDKTTLQIEYPSHAPYHEKSKLEDKFSDDSVEILDENPPHLNTKCKSPSSSTRPQKKQKIGTHEDFEQMPSLKTEKELGEEMGGNAFIKKIYQNSKQKTKMRRLTDAEKTEILKRMKTFRSKNPFFTVIIQPSYVSNKSPLVCHKTREEGHPTSEENLKPEPPMRKQDTLETKALAKDTSSEFRNPFFKIVMQNSHVSTHSNLVESVIKEQNQLLKKLKILSRNPFFRVCIRPCHVHRSQPVLDSAIHRTVEMQPKLSIGEELTSISESIPTVTSNKTQAIIYIVVEEVNPEPPQSDVDHPRTKLKFLMKNLNTLDNRYHYGNPLEKEEKHEHERENGITEDDPLTFHKQDSNSHKWIEAMNEKYNARHWELSHYWKVTLSK